MLTFLGVSATIVDRLPFWPWKQGIIGGWGVFHIVGTWRVVRKSKEKIVIFFLSITNTGALKFFDYLVYGSVGWGQVIFDAPASLAHKDISAKSARINDGRKSTVI